LASGFIQSSKFFLTTHPSDLLDRPFLAKKAVGAIEHFTATSSHKESLKVK